jgi:SAM-dependent methyltransferase
LLRRRPGHHIRADADIWVAGCGTQQGIHWALCFPEATIVATDISETSLGIASGLAQQLGLTNVRFEKKDLMQPAFANQFDLIVSTGVIHHLPDPAVGLAHLRAALRPGGATVLMVYSTMHRQPLATFRSAADLLAGDALDPDTRYAFAGSLLNKVLASPRCSPPCPEALDEMARLHEVDRAFVADALIHPLETTYDIDGLLALLQGASLDHRSWLYPVQWDLEAYLDDPQALARFDQLDPVAQWKVIYNLAGYTGPLLQCLLEADKTPRLPAYTQEELLDMPVVCSQGVHAYKVEAGQIVAEGTQPAYAVDGDALVGHPAGGFGSKWPWRMPAEAQPILAACDGSRTVGEVMDLFADDFGRQPVFDLLCTCLPQDLGLIVPSW